MTKRESVYLRKKRLTRRIRRNSLPAFIDMAMAKNQMFMILSQPFQSKDAKRVAIADVLAKTAQRITERFGGLTEEMKEQFAKATEALKDLREALPQTEVPTYPKGSPSGFFPTLVKEGGGEIIIPHEKLIASGKQND